MERMTSGFCAVFVLVLWAALLLLGGGRNPYILAAACVPLAAVAGFGGVSLSNIALLWLLWLGVTVLFAAEPLAALGVFAVWLAGFMLYGIAAKSSSAVGEKNVLRVVTIAGYALALGVILLRLLGIEPSLYILPPNQNYAAALIASGFAAGLSFLFRADYPAANKKKMALFLLLPAASVFVLHSRSGFFAMVFAAAVILWLNGLKKTAIAGLALPAIVLMLAPDFILKSHDAFSFSRPVIWTTALSAAFHNPVFGVGPGGFENAYMQYSAPVFNGISYYWHYTPHAHNQLLQFAAETGVVGLALYLAFFVAVFRRAALGAKYGYAAVLTALFAASFFEGVFMLPAVLFLMFIIAGFADEGRDTRGGCVLAFVMLAGLSVFSFGRASIKVHPKTAELYAMRGEAELLRPQAEPYRALELFSRAAFLSPHNAVYKYQVGEIFLRLGAPASARLWLNDAVRLEPNFLRAKASLAVCLLAQNNKPAAAAMLDDIDRRAAALSALPARGYDALIARRDTEKENFLRKSLIVTSAK